MSYVYHEHESIVDATPERFDESCEIVRAVILGSDPDPTNDTYVIRFADGFEREAFPEELDPIPTPGTGRKEVTPQ